jgi:peptidoglycan/xylan/chitin deacetylase (PgdA/CDA1 family)
VKRKIKGDFKNLLAATPGFLALATWYTRYTPKIFMLHRFCHRSDHHDPSVAGPSFEKQLRWLKCGKWNVINLRQYLAQRRIGQRLPPYTIILTIDDGYRDFYDVAYPLLVKHNLTATFFVTTRFVEGNFWLWHDRIDYALRKTDRKTFQIEISGEKRSFDLRNEADIRATWQAFSDYCVTALNQKKWDMIHRLEDTMEVAIPESVPPEYVAVTWSQLCEMQSAGIDIGSHTCSHPILSKIAPEKLEQEIAGSKTMIEDHLRTPIVSFCYPNGRSEDISPLVVEHVKKAGYHGATHGCNLDFTNLYRLPRMGIGNNITDFKWKLSGLEMLLNQYA